MWGGWREGEKGRGESLVGGNKGVLRAGREGGRREVWVAGYTGTRGRGRGRGSGSGSFAGA